MKEAKIKGEGEKVKKICMDVGFAGILPEPHPIGRSGSITELSQLGSRWLIFVPHTS